MLQWDENLHSLREDTLLEVAEYWKDMAAWFWSGLSFVSRDICPVLECRINSVGEIVHIGAGLGMARFCFGCVFTTHGVFC